MAIFRHDVFFSDGEPDGARLVKLSISEHYAATIAEHIDTLVTIKL
jgi:hypothetical protein